MKRIKNKNKAYCHLNFLTTTHLIIHRIWFMVLLGSLLSSCSSVYQQLGEKINIAEKDSITIENVKPDEKKCGGTIDELIVCSSWAKEEAEQLAIEQGIEQFIASLEESLIKANLTHDMIRGYVIGILKKPLRLDPKAGAREDPISGRYFYTYTILRGNVQIYVSRVLNDLLSEKKSIIPSVDPLVFIHIGFGDFGSTYQDAINCLSQLGDDVWALPSIADLESIRARRDDYDIDILQRVSLDKPYWTADRSPTGKPYGYCFEESKEDEKNKDCKHIGKEQYNPEDALAMLFVRKSKQ